MKVYSVLPDYPPTKTMEIDSVKDELNPSSSNKSDIEKNKPKQVIKKY